MPQADYHIHTFWCGHADGTMEEYVEHAIALGLPEMGFSPHLPLDIPIEDKVCLTFEEMEAFLDEFNRLRKAYADAIPLRLGGEADYIPGTEKEIERLNQQYGLEYLIGSIHFLGDWAFDHPKYIDGFSKQPIDRVYSDYFGLVADAAKTGLFDVIGHLDLPKKFGHRPENGCVSHAERALAAMAGAGVAVEINTAGRDKPAAEFYPCREVLAACRRAGIKLTFGSDSHAPGEVGRYFDEAADLARSVGYTRTLRLGPEREEIDLPGS